MTKPKQELRALTGLRFAAALYVVVFHFARPGAWAGGTSSWLTAIHNCGYLGVGVFFVLSGFILTYVYCQDEAASIDRTKFWRARFARVYPLYLFSFLLAAPVYISHRFATDPGAHSAIVKIGFGGAAYLALLQAWIPGATHTWNTVAWTLSVETAFYIVFPVLAPRLGKIAPPLAGLTVLWIAGVVPAAMYSYGVSRHVISADPLVQIYLQEIPLLQIPTFLFGVLLGYMYLRRDRSAPNRGTLLTIAGLAGIFGAAAFSDSIPPVLLHNGLLLPFFGLLIYGLASGGTIARWMSRSPIVLLGEASYGMYLLQYPVWCAILYLSGTYRVGDYFTEVHTNPGLADPRVFCAGFAALIALSIFTLRVIETPARRWLQPRTARPVELAVSER